MSKDIRELFTDLTEEQINKINKIEEIINQEKKNLENELSNLKKDIQDLRMELSHKEEINKINKGLPTKTVRRGYGGLF